MNLYELTGLFADHAAGLLRIYPRSVVEVDGTTLFLARTGEGKVLGVVGDVRGFEEQGPSGSPAIPRNTRDPVMTGSAILGPLSAANAQTVRARVPWLRPEPLGLKRSAGCGDRLGLATPGHIRAVRSVGGIAPIFAQQSMRENARTGRSPQQVLDDATWGVLQEGWREPWGADADHLKTTQDIDRCVAAGYTLYTIDPGDHVDNEAHGAPLEVVQAKLEALPWQELEDSAQGLRSRYLDRAFEIEGLRVEFDETSLAQAAAKYGRAIAHTVRMYRHLAAQSRYFELEMSVDETDTPTSVEEHLFIASELKRLGVQWVSLAPRYIGRFEKAVDYIGDLGEFERELAKHAAVARALGPYKLSIHSGSDKFSIYRIIAKQTVGLVHLKTAGTSYLEALRTLAEAQPALFREILDYARQRYEADRATYIVSAEVARVPSSDQVTDGDLVGLLDEFHAREVLHVTFGSVLDRFGPRLMAALQDNEEAYEEKLEVHMRRHLEPLS